METIGKDAITSLLLNVTVFKLAQRFSLPQLEEYTMGMLMGKERYFTNCHLDKLLSLVFDVTAHDDTKFRYVLFLRCVENYTIVQSLPKAVEQLESNLFVTWRHALKAEQDLIDKDKDMRRQKSAHKVDLRMQEKANGQEARGLRNTIRLKDNTVDDLEDSIRNLERKVEKLKKETRRLRLRFTFWGHA